MADADEPGELFQQDLEKDSSVTEALHALQLTLDLSQEVLGKAAELSRAWERRGSGCSRSGCVCTWRTGSR